MQNENKVLSTNQNDEKTIAVNPNPAANNNIKEHVTDMTEREKEKAAQLPNSEITDGEDG